MSRGWRYMAQRLNGDGTDGDFLDIDLPLEDVQIENVISGHNSLSAKIEPVYSRLLADDGLPILGEWGTAIYAENDGDIRGAGILVDSAFEGPSWGIECIGWTGYAQGMPYTGKGYAGTEVDPLDVVREVWSHIQAQRGGNIGLQVSNLKTDKKIGVNLKKPEFDKGEDPVESPGDDLGNYEAGPYKLAWYQNHDLAEDIDKLADETPFDYMETHQWDGDVIRHRLHFGYPQIGENRKDLRFVFGENIFEMPSLTRSGDDYATEAVVLGAGEGRKMIQGTAFRPRRGGLRRVAVVTDTSLRSQKSATKRANKEMQWRSQLDDITEIIAVDHPHAPLGSVSPGDTIRASGRVSDWREVDLTCRVLSVGIAPADAGRAVYTIARTDRTTE